MGDIDGAVVVAIDKDKMSQYALKWAVEHVLNRGQTVTLVHVRQKQSGVPTPGGSAVSFSDLSDEVARTLRQENDLTAKEIFLPFRCFLSRKDIKCEEVILEESDVSRALVDYVHSHVVEVLVVGASSRNGLVRLLRDRKFRGPDVAANVTRNTPEFCTVYVIQKGKMLSVKSATRPVPRGPVRAQQQTHNHHSDSIRGGDRGAPHTPPRYPDEGNSIRSPFTRGRAANGKSYGEINVPECDISFVSSGRPSTERSSFNYDRNSFESADYASSAPRLSNGSDNRTSFGSEERISIGSSAYSERRSFDLNSVTDSSSNFSGFSGSSAGIDDVENEMRRLKLELKQTMDMYNAACKEALSAKQKALELQKIKTEENQRLEEAREAEEAAMALADQERAKCRAAVEAADAAQKIADLEAQKRMCAEMKARREGEERKKAMSGMTHNDVRYRRYTIDEIEAATEYFSASLKIGEGGYGPVYRCMLDHTHVAIKVLRPDAAQGQEQFQQEVEILSCIRHPNMVLLLGACPEYGCLVYEYMYNGSLEDRLFHRGKSPPLTWQLRFKIAAEIATGLLFLHQAKPEPLVHRDLKPANILIDRNYVSKISDVGLARLVPPSVADSVTQYRMTQAAGTFCYIDPEYQQTGMLGTRSDIYSLGILYLQLITAKPAMGLTHHVQRSLERGTFREMLDPGVQDWPYDEVLEFTQLALRCAELRRKDRPDLTQILPVLNRLRDFAEDHMPNFYMFGPPMPAGPSRLSHVSAAHPSPEVISEHPSTLSDNSNGQSVSSTASS